MARDKVDLHRSTLTDWVGRSTALLEPLAAQIGKLVRARASPVRPLVADCCAIGLPGIG